MKKLKILAIAPYAGLKNSIDQVAAKRMDVEITTCVGDLASGVALAKQMLQQQSYDMILSRGGTADLLRKELDLPTLDISISLGDILHAIKLAENYRSQFTIVGFPSITERAQMLCRMLRYEIGVYTIHAEQDTIQVLTRLREEGCRMCIGDVITTNVARQLGMNAILITSGTESIETALEQMVSLSASYFHFKRDRMLFERIIQCAPYEILIYDRNLKLTYSTFGKEEISQDLQLFIQSALPTLWNEKAKRIERTLGQEYIRIDAKKIDDEDTPLILYLSRKPIPPSVSEGSISVQNSSDLMLEGFNRYYGFCGATDDFSRAIEQFGKQQMPIMLLGEQGTGKDSVAAYLYSIGPYSANPLYTVDCQLISDKNLLALLKNPNSPLNELRVTLYFKNILTLNPLRQEQMIQFLETLSLDKRRRILCSFSTQTDDGQDMERHLSTICTRLHAVSFRLPALRERKEDISSIATLFLSQLNILLGKQLTGFEPQALEMLTAYDWPYNLDQFHSVLQELAEVTSSFYISAEDTASILRRENAKHVKHACAGINLNQSFEEIMREVLCTVLQQEGNNQKRAAQRLGIARSTIWRMLHTKEEPSAPQFPK